MSENIVANFYQTATLYFSFFANRILLHPLYFNKTIQENKQFIISLSHSKNYILQK